MGNVGAHLQDFELDYDGRKHEVGLVSVAIEPDGGTKEERIRRRMKSLLVSVSLLSVE